MTPPLMPPPSISFIPGASPFTNTVTRRPRLSSGALRRLDIALRLAAPGDPAGMAELRDAVREQVTHLRSQGEPPERVLVEIKREIQEALTRVNAPRDDEFALRPLTDQVVRWCIEAYYRAD
jgi:hypothetical protein